MATNHKITRASTKDAAKEAAPRQRKALVVPPAAYSAVDDTQTAPTAEDRAIPASQMVTATVPVAFTLTLDDHRAVHYEAGTQEMPKDDAEHWFAKAQGVEIYKGRG